MPVELICQNCGKPFKTRPANAKSGRAKFCSRSCAVSATHKGLPKPKSRDNIKAAHAAIVGRPPWNKGELISKICEICGMVFEVQPNRASARFCSLECTNAWKRTITGTDHPLFTRVKMSCEMCGKEVWVKRAKVSEFRFCSRRCQGSYTSKQWPHESSIEQALQSEFIHRNIPFEAQYAIGPYVVDFAFPESRLAVEADGTYWHGNDKQQAKDRRKNGFLKKTGWNVLRLGEKDIKANTSACVDRIVSLL